MSRANQPLVVLDWDTALFPTSQLKKGNLINSNDVKALMQSVYRVLTRFIHLYGSSNVIILTHGSRDWVLKILLLMNERTNNTVSRISDLIRLIQRTELTVLSSRDSFAKIYPKKPYLWTRKVYLQLLRSRFVRNESDDITAHAPLRPTFICIGHTIFEHLELLEAVERINDEHNLNILLHRIALASCPSISCMLKQLEFIQDVSHVIPMHDSPINIDYKQEMALHQAANNTRA